MNQIYRRASLHINDNDVHNEEIDRQLIPIIGGPMKEATPWKSKTMPKALVSFSIPNKSTIITDVRLT